AAADLFLGDAPHAAVLHRQHGEGLCGDPAGLEHAGGVGAVAGAPAADLARDSGLVVPGGCATGAGVCVACADLAAVADDAPRPAGGAAPRVCVAAGGVRAVRD